MKNLNLEFFFFKMILSGISVIVNIYEIINVGVK